MKYTDLDLTALFDIADECIEMYHQEINAIQAVGYNRGLLNSTATWAQGANENEIILKFVLPDYYIFVEDGRNPSVRRVDPQKVYESILRWVKAKGITGKPKNGQKPPTQEQIAWAIYKKIHRIGYYGRQQQGKHPLQTTKQRMESAHIKEKVIELVRKNLNNRIKADIDQFAKLKK
jgi:hypothetical protein